MCSCYSSLLSGSRPTRACGSPSILGGGLSLWSSFIREVVAFAGAAAVIALLLIMEQQPAQQPGAADALRGRELMRLPAQSRGVSRSRSRSPISQHPDGGDSDEEYHRRVRAEETKVNVVLAKIFTNAAVWGLPAFDDTKTLVGFYLRDFDDGEILFEPAWALSNLLPADVALARYG